MTRHPLDPRIVNVCFDANAFDSRDEKEEREVVRLLALYNKGMIRLVPPAGVREETRHPHTPATVRDVVAPLIYSITVELNDNERRLYTTVRSILRGNATSGKHDADAGHICEAAKYGGYFITHDRRVIITKRVELEAVLPPSLHIVTLSDFLRIYDDYKAAE